MEKPVRERFINAVTYLLENELAPSKKEIAASMGKNSSWITEVLKRRMGIKPEMLQKFLDSWPVNPDYIYHRSEEIPLNQDQSSKDHTIIQGNNSNGMSGTSTAIFQLINRIKSDQLNSKERNKIGDELAEIIAGLIDENSSLKSDLVETYRMLQSKLK